MGADPFNWNSRPWYERWFLTFLLLVVCCFLWVYMACSKVWNFVTGKD